MRKRLSGLLPLILVSTVAWANGGVVTVASKHDGNATTDRLESIVKEKGMTVFARVDHTAGAESVGEKLSYAEVLIFGNPKLGTKLMQCEIQVGLDLPIRVLVSTDAAGKTHLSYNAPAYLKDKYHVKGCDGVFEQMKNALGNMVNAAAS